MIEFDGKKPIIHETCFIASNSTLIGNVTVDEYSSIWYNTVVRADLNRIIIGKRTCVQDNSVLHVEKECAILIGNNVLIAHNTVIHGCSIGDGALIGISSVLMNGVEIGESSIIGAGSIVTENTKIPPRTLALGVPAKVVKEITPQHIDSMRKAIDTYVELAQEHKRLPINKFNPNLI